VRGLEESLAGIQDERRQSGHLLHKLVDVLVIGLTTVIAGWGECAVMEDFGKAREGFFRKFLELPSGIPDESATKLPRPLHGFLRSSIPRN